MTDGVSKPNHFRLAWVALLVLAVGFAASATMWYAIRSHEQTEVGWATKLAADAVKIDLATDVQWQIYGLDRLALLWQAAYPAQKIWTDNAELYMQHRPGSIAVEWISADGKIRSVVYGKSFQNPPLAFEGSPTSLMDAAAKSKVAMFSGTVIASSGRKQWAIAYPVYERGELKGFVISFFDFDQSLGYIVDDLKPLDFSFELSQGQEHLFLKPGSDRTHEQEWTTIAEIPLPGGKWEVRVWPNPTAVDRIRSRLPEVILLAGSIFSLLMAFIFHLMIGASRVSKRIGLMNEDLKREVKSRTQAQEELSRVHEQLEARVQERTAELAKANEMLEREIQQHQTAESSLRELNGRLFHLQDEERRRLARELHDGATQELVALALNVETFREVAKDGRSLQTLNECVTLIQQCTSELRTISYLLHPPFFDELGLAPALRSYVEGFAKRSGIQITLEVEPHLARLGHETELTIFRVVQEALANVHRHSQSRVATVLLFRDAGNIRLEVIDEGRGIPPDVLDRVQEGLAGMGTAGMRERIRLLGGHLEISSDNTGTCVRALVPMSSQQSGLSEAKTSAA